MDRYRPTRNPATPCSATTITNRSFGNTTRRPYPRNTPTRTTAATSTTPASTTSTSRNPLENYHRQSASTWTRPPRNTRSKRTREKSPHRRTRPTSLYITQIPVATPPASLKTRWSLTTRTFNRPNPFRSRTIRSQYANARSRSHSSTTRN